MSFPGEACVPGRDRSQRPPRRAGMAVPLFSLRTASDWGIGEIPDLVPLAMWAARMGQSIIQLLPINETSPSEASPYAALSAFALDPIYLGIGKLDDVDHQYGLPAMAVPPMAAEARVLPRAAVRKAKLSVLEQAWDTFRKRHLTERSERGRRFVEFVDRESQWLHDYALFRVLKERYEWRFWCEWPEPLRNRHPAALREVTEQLAERIDFHRYVQWLMFEQWSAVRARLKHLGVSIMGDLPFVIGSDSADAWVEPALFVPGWEVGAPPDDFSASGQNWGLPLYDWGHARQSDFAWWRARVRQSASLYDLFRIDHIVGVFRTFGIPAHAQAAPRFHPEHEEEQIAQGEAFLRMVVQESGGASPVAEDLGIIPPFVRDVLRRQGVPGYAVMRWERRDGALIDPREYPDLSVATTGTHDTSTLVEWWGEMSPAERHDLALSLDLEIPESCMEQTSPDDLVRRGILRRIFQAGSDLVLLPVQDLFGWPERINLPMTESRLNWNYRLPFELGPQGQVPPEVERESRAIRDLVAQSDRHLPPLAESAS